MNASVALVYDRVNTPYGGAEQVLTALHQIFPQAPLYTSVHHPRARWADDFEIRTSFIQKLPFAKKLHRFYVSLMPLAFESFDLSDFDIIISVTSAEAKGVITKPNQLHLCYLLTPTRYLYSHRTHYEQSHWPFKLPLIGWLSKKIFDYLTWWDQTAASRPDVIVPISNLVKKRTNNHYQRSATKPIYPPLNLDELQPEADLAQYKPYYLPENYQLIISRLVPYKRLDLAIQACQQLGESLVIIGQGPQQAELEKMAGENVYFLGAVSHQQKQAIMLQAKSLLMPGVEDFGITALEAISLGLPVVLHQETGAAEILRVLEKEDGQKRAVYLKKLSIEALKKALLNLPKKSSNLGKLRENMQQYAINDFKKRFEETVFKFYQQL